MKIFPSRTLLFLLLGSFWFPSPGYSEEPPQVRPALPAQSSLDEQARFLAGIPLDAESPLASRQANSIYLEHLRDFGKSWQRFRSEHFLPKTTWSAEEMAALAPPLPILYYLFSGPDILNALALFPQTNTFVLVGLESIGQLPPPEGLEDSSLAEGLANLRKATDTTLQFSYFITKEMKTDLEQTEFRGVLPVLYTFLALSGGTIVDTDLVSIDSKGALLESTGGAVPGVRIRFSSSSSISPRTVFYFRADLSNSGLSGPSAGLLRWMKDQQPGAAYLKAASYLLHENYFSQARQFLLRHAPVILQDDSGIPLRFFSPDIWNLYFFGTYSKPLEIFSTKFQPELLRSYELAGGGRPLPFGTGYNWEPGTSNLMLAVRKDLAQQLGVPEAKPVAPSEDALTPD